MMRSLFSGVSGMRVHQTRMDVIANNIANVNTNGFKASRVTFAEIFSQTSQGASAANPGALRGGTNPTQIGLGTSLASIDRIMTQGAAQRTDNPFDLMVQGEGFFIVSDAGGTFFTRAGAFRLDEAGNLVNPDGLILNGWRAFTEAGETTIPRTMTQGIQISGDDKFMPPEATSYIRMTGNLDTRPENHIRQTSLTFFDTLGNMFQVPKQFTLDPVSGVWNVELANYAFMNNDRTRALAIDITVGVPANTNVNAPGAGQFPFPVEIEFTGAERAAIARNWYNTDVAINFTDRGILDPSATHASSMQILVDGLNNIVPEAAIPEIITVSYLQMTQFRGASDATAETIDGNAMGTLIGLSVGPDGRISGRYSNGQTRVLWQIALAQFRNPAGLESIGSDLFTQTMNSGQFDGVGVPAEAGTRIMAGVLEMSNVDLAQEFTEMITTQRGFQANSRVISTSDEMLQELVNLRR